jgi:hypothetical protein
MFPRLDEFDDTRRVYLCLWLWLWVLLFFPREEVINIYLAISSDTAVLGILVIICQADRDCYE